MQVQRLPAALEQEAEAQAGKAGPTDSGERETKSFTSGVILSWNYDQNWF